MRRLRWRGCWMLRLGPNEQYEDMSLDIGSHISLYLHIVSSPGGSETVAMTERGRSILMPISALCESNSNFPPIKNNDLSRINYSRDRGDCSLRTTISTKVPQAFLLSHPLPTRFCRHYPRRLPLSVYHNILL